MKDSNADGFARFLAVVAVVISGTAAFFEYSQSPLYPSRAPLLSYWQAQSHNGQTNDGRFDGTTVVYVRNASAIVARDVRVVVWSPCDRTPVVQCLEPVATQEAKPGMFVIQIQGVPANSTVEIEVATKMEPPSGRNPWICEPWLEAPAVRSVYSEFGDVLCLYEKCTQNFTSQGFCGGAL